eukprot:CAMPEP_0202701528 /NCGR_PEP_ID=MMETSP1385-20130828/14622_1 /ASSEMBLY_ACC=CAM_ASM_000861 /TAXON_ID=933848 /ORGANISM="Elphidium margaritaceum" /LENGTH=56 /DNA_ID=CAMNT_0049358973 /DNA_START=295 /DNA_END=461 /DNA_ORIENTATION=-
MSKCSNAPKVYPQMAKQTQNGFNVNHFRNIHDAVMLVAKYHKVNNGNKNGSRYNLS